MMRTAARMLALASTLLFHCAAQAQAQVQDWYTTTSAEIWTLGRHQGLNAEAPFNPRNQVIDLARRSVTTELLWETRGQSGPLAFKLRARGVNEHCNCVADGVHGEVYASQAYLKWQLDDESSVIAGRQLLTWGPAIYRLPSNPFYFDAGRTNLFRELSGLDAIQYATYRGDWSFFAAQVLGSGHVGGREGENFNGSQIGSTEFRRSTLLRAEYQHAATTLGAVVARQQHGSGFVGGYGAWSFKDGWLLWSEVGWGRRPWSLMAGPGNDLALVVEQPSRPAATGLIGASYTFDKGQTLHAEYLYDGHGLSRDESDALAAVGTLAGNLLGSPRTGEALNTLFRGARYVPVSANRHYLALAWQGTAQRERLLGRVTWNGNLVDASHRTSFYVEHSFSRHVSGLLSLVLDKGRAGDEFGSQLRHRFTAGLKFRLF
jgi:hypothetical protein